MNPQDPDDTFYRDSANRLSDEMLKILGIPPVLKKLILKSEQDKLENGSASAGVESLPTGLTETEQKLAKVWKTSLQLSPEQYAALNQESSLDDFLVGCSTLEIDDLEKQIEKVFGIVINEVAIDAIDNYATLSEFAAFIDAQFTYTEPIRFVTHWLSTIYNDKTTAVEKTELLLSLPADCRAEFLELVQDQYLRSQTIVFRDVYPRVSSEAQVQVAVKAEVFLSSKSSLAITEDLNLVFRLETEAKQSFQILAVQPLTAA